MIKYRDIKYSYIKNTTIRSILSKYPVRYTSAVGNISYSIPLNDSYVVHREDGPAFISPSNVSYNTWYWYGTATIYKEEWLDPSWRKRVEIRVFL